MGHALDVAAPHLWVMLDCTQAPSRPAPTGVLQVPEAIP